MASRDSKPARTDPYYLAAPVGWQTAMEVKRRFAGSEPPIPVVGAASVDAAIGRLEDNPRCVAVLIHFAEMPRAAIELICRIKERWRRPVVCFHPAWHRDDVRRALQLGADSLLGWPFDPGEVLGDLEALHKAGVSVTRKALLDRGGPALLAPDPALWVEEDDDWRDRLAGLAERLRTPAEEEQGRVTRIDPAANFTRAAGGSMTPALAGATMTVLRVGTQHLPQVAGEYGVDPSQLEKTVEVGLQVPDDERRDGMLAWLEDLARSGGEEAETGVMAQLRRAAQVTLQAQGELQGEIDVLANALSRATGVPVSSLEGLSAATRSELSSRVLASDESEDALDHVRMLVLASLLEDLGQRPTTAHDLAALTALLGLRAGVDGIRPAELVRALARLDPPAAMQGLDLRRLAPVREAIPTPGNALDQLLRRAIDELVKAAAPMGYVDQNRLVALLRAARQGGAVLVGPTTWRTVAEVIAGRRRSADARAVKIVQRLERLMAVSGTDARSRLVRALSDLIERSRNPMDAGRFVAWCRDAATGVVRTESVAGRVEPGGGALAGLDRADQALEQVPASLAGASSGFDPASLLGAPPETRSGPIRGPATRSGPQAPDFADSPSSMAPADAGGPSAPVFDPTAMLAGQPATRSGPQQMPATRSGPHHMPATRSGPQQMPTTRSGPQHTPTTGSGDASGAGAQAAGGSRMPEWLDPGPAAAGSGSSRADRPASPSPQVKAAARSPALDAVDALVAQGALDQLASAVESLPDDEPSAPEALNRAALELYVAGRADEADPLWTRAAALGPDRPNILLHLARLRFEQGRRGEARLLVRQVLALRPHLTPAQTLRARIEG